MLLLAMSLGVQITGLLLIAIMCLGYYFALPWPRKYWPLNKLAASRWLTRFESFYFTHIFMATAVLVLLILHPLPGPAVHPRPHRSTTWAYMAAGVIIYILERMARILRFNLCSLCQTLPKTLNKAPAGGINLKCDAKHLIIASSALKTAFNKRQGCGLRILLVRILSISASTGVWRGSNQISS